MKKFYSPDGAGASGAHAQLSSTQAKTPAQSMVTPTVTTGTDDILDHLPLDFGTPPTPEGLIAASLLLDAFESKFSVVINELPEEFTFKEFFNLLVRHTGRLIESTSNYHREFEAMVWKRYFEPLGGDVEPYFALLRYHFCPFDAMELMVLDRLLRSEVGRGCLQQDTFSLLPWYLSSVLFEKAR